MPLTPVSTAMPKGMLVSIDKEVEKIRKAPWAYGFKSTKKITRSDVVRRIIALWIMSEEWKDRND